MKDRLPKITIPTTRTDHFNLDPTVKYGKKEISIRCGIPGGLLANYHETFIGAAELSAASDYYLFRLPKPTTQDPHKERYAGNSGVQYRDIKFFYPNAIRAVDEFSDTASSLWDTGVAMAENTAPTPDDYISASQSILRDGYEQTRTFSIVNAAKATAPSAVLHVRGVAKIQIMQVFKEIGSEKPESFREAVRRHIPRWMWHPIPFPEEEVAGEREEKLRQLWGGYTSRDASFLIHSDSLAEGQAPFHMIMKAAQKVEKDGAQDLGYAIRTYAITQLLEMEKERAHPAETREMPFFTYVLGGIMAGDIKNPSKNAHFNYQGALQETIQQTGKRLTEELKQGEEGPATAFIQKLLQYYPDDLPQLLAHSFSNRNGIRNGINLLIIMQGLATLEQPWAAQLRERIFALPQRRILTNDELIQLSKFLPLPEAATSTTSLQDDIQQIIGEEDIYSFKKKLREGNGIDIDLTIELDNVTKGIDVMFVYKNGTAVRYIPFHIDFASGIEVLSTEIMGDENLPRPIIDSYKNLMLKTIQDRADEIRAREVKPSGNGMTVHQRTTTHDLLPADTSAFTPQRVEPKVKVKTRGVAGKQTEEAVVSTDEASESLPQMQGKFTLGGLDIPTITSLLETEGIEAVTPERIQAKVMHHLEMANANNWPPGKHLILEELDKKAVTLDLRQINWAIDGNQIRILLFGTGNGHYELCGIINKKGSNQQNLYLRQLIKRLRSGKIRP